jgi:hypothetical protein
MKRERVITEVIISLLIGGFWIFLIYVWYTQFPSWYVVIGMVLVAVVFTFFAFDYTFNYFSRPADSELETVEQKLEIENWLGFEGYKKISGTVKFEENGTLNIISNSGKFIHTFSSNKTPSGNRGNYTYWVFGPFLGIRYRNEGNRWYEKSL